MPGRPRTAARGPRARTARRPVKLLLSLTLGLCTAAALAPPGQGQPSAKAHPSSAAPLGGVNIPSISRGTSLAAVDREIALARSLRVKVVRVEVSWSHLEPNGPGQIDPSALAAADRLMNDAKSAGIGVIALVQSTPCWASSAPASLLQACSTGESSQAHAWPPSDPGSYASFVAFLAQRYGSALTAIEVWNEPDQSNELYFAGPEKPQRYAAILRAAYPAIKHANPHVLVLGGSLVGSNGVFLRLLYAAGIKGYYDGLSVHFYTLVLGSLRAIHEVQVANGDSKPLWLNEFGWTSCWPRERRQQEQGCVTPATQATNLTNMLRSLARTPYIAAEVVYSLMGSAREDFGVLSASGARKPAFSALSKVLTNPFGRPSPVTLSLTRHGGHLLAAGSGPVGDYMQLEAFKGGALRYRSLFVLDRFNRYSMALPRVLGTSGLRVRVYQYWAGSGRRAQKSI
jgi:Cellulase (glycosyl hydrolase family 5)